MATCWPHELFIYNGSGSLYVLISLQVYHTHILSLSHYLPLYNILEINDTEKEDDIIGFYWSHTHQEKAVTNQISDSDPLRELWWSDLDSDGLRQIVADFLEAIQAKWMQVKRDLA